MFRQLLALSIGFAIFSSVSPADACAMDPNSCAQTDHARYLSELGRQTIEDHNRAAHEANAAAAAAGSRPPPPDPIQIHVNGAIANFQLMKSYSDELMERQNDPRVQAYLNGKWEFFQDKVSARPGEYCAAFFARKGGFVMISGPGREYPGALLTFWGEKVPRPEKLGTVQVTLKQTGEAPQTVTAYNYGFRGQRFGAVMLKVPTIEAALVGMLDAQEFELLIGSQSVVTVAWRDGLKARDELRRCVAKWKA